MSLRVENVRCPSVELTKQHRQRNRYTLDREKPRWPTSPRTDDQTGIEG